MKRIAHYVWIISFIVGFVMSSGVTLAEEQPSFTLTSSASRIQPNEQVTLKVSGHGLTNTSAYEIRLRLDSSDVNMAELTLKSQKNLLPRSGFTALTKNGNRLTFAFAIQGGQSTVNGDTDLSSFSFTGASIGQVRVTLESIKLMDGDLSATTYTNLQSVDLSINNGSSPPTPTPTPTPLPIQLTVEPKPSVTDAIITYTSVIPDASGVVHVTVPSDRWNQVVSNAQGGRAKIVVQPQGAVRTVVVDIPIEPFQTTSSGQIRWIEVDTGLASITFEPGVVKNYMGTTTSQIQISVSKTDVSSLPANLVGKIANHPVFEFDLKVNGKKVNTFTGVRPVKVYVPYSLQPGEDPNQIVVYYFDENGKLEVVSNSKYNQSIGRVSFEPKHFSSYTVIPAQVNFTDLYEVPWAKAGINGLAAREVIQGVDNARFDPNRNVTRAEFIRMLMGVFDLSDKQVKSSFSDVEEGSWYYEVIATAEKLGIVKGRENGIFGIREEISRQDMAVMINRAAQVSGIEWEANGKVTDFADRYEIAPYAIESVDDMQTAGILEGLEDNRFRPSDPATRAQAAVVLYRLHGKQ